MRISTPPYVSDVYLRYEYCEQQEKSGCDDCELHGLNGSSTIKKAFSRGI